MSLRDVSRLLAYLSPLARSVITLLHILSCAVIMLMLPATGRHHWPSPPMLAVFQLLARPLDVRAWLLPAAHRSLPPLLLPRESVLVAPSDTRV